MLNIKYWQHIDIRVRLELSRWIKNDTIFCIEEYSFNTDTRVRFFETDAELVSTLREEYDMIGIRYLDLFEEIRCVWSLKVEPDSVFVVRGLSDGSLANIHKCYKEIPNYAYGDDHTIWHLNNDIPKPFEPCINKMKEADQLFCIEPFSGGDAVFFKTRTEMISSLDGYPCKLLGKVFNVRLQRLMVTWWSPTEDTSCYKEETLGQMNALYIVYGYGDCHCGSLINMNCIEEFVAKHKRFPNRCTWDDLSARQFINLTNML